MQISSTLKRIAKGHLKRQAFGLGVMFATAGFVSHLEKLQRKEEAHRELIKGSYDFHMNNLERSVTIVPLPGEYPGDYYYDFISMYSVSPELSELTGEIVEMMNLVKEDMEKAEDPEHFEFIPVVEAYHTFLSYINEKVLSKDLLLKDATVIHNELAIIKANFDKCIESICEFDNSDVAVAAQ